MGTPPREQAGFCLLIQSPSPVRAGFRWALWHSSRTAFLLPTPYQSTQVTGWRPPWVPGPDLPAFGRVGNNLSGCWRFIPFTAVRAPYRQVARSLRGCSARVGHAARMQAPRVPASPTEGLPLPLTRRAIRPPPGFPRLPAIAGRGIPQGGESPLTGARAVACGAVCKGYTTHTPRGLPSAHGWGFHPLPTRPAAGVSGSLPPRRPFPRRPSSAPDPSGYLHALGSKRGVYPLPCPVECRASPHFRRHAASPATATCRHRHRRSGPGATRGRVQ